MFVLLWIVCVYCASLTDVPLCISGGLMFSWPSVPDASFLAATLPASLGVAVLVVAVATALAFSTLKLS